MKKILQIVVLSCIPSFALAGFFDDVLDSAKKAGKQAGEMVNEAVQSVEEHGKSATDEQDSSGQNDQQSSASGDTENAQETVSTASAPNPGSEATAANVSQPKSGDISIEDIPAGRRPSSYRLLSLAKLRFDQSWLTGDNLIKSTELSIDCQQRYRKNSFAGIKHSGCMGEIVRHGDLDLRLAAVFADSAIEGRNPKFAARELQQQQYDALVKLARHLTPEFGDTVRWRGAYDFQRGVLTLDLRGLAKAQGDITGRLPESVQHLDIRQTQSRNNWDGTGGEFYPLNIAPGYVGGATAIAFNRDLSKGELALAPAKAESLLPKGQDYVTGLAVVEYDVTGVAGEAVLAKLHKVLILSAGNDPTNLHGAKPLLELPANSFPRIAAPAPVVSKQPQPIQKKAAEPEPASVPQDPLLRVSKGKPYGPDIVDLRLGMTLAEAESAIRKHKKPREIVTGKAQKPFTAIKGYLLEPGDETITVAVLDSPAGERVAAYARYLWFDPGSAPSQVAIATSLEKKYGKTSYVYEVNNQFKRRWDTDWSGTYVSEEERYQKQIGHCEAGASMRSNLGMQKADGSPNIWYLPWFSERPVGTFWAIKPGNLRSLDEHFNRCGTTLEANYDSGSGELYGPTLSFLLFDGPWIMQAAKQAEADEAAKGAQGLDL